MTKPTSSKINSSSKQGFQDCRSKINSPHKFLQFPRSFLQCSFGFDFSVKVQNYYN